MQRRPVHSPRMYIYRHTCIRRPRTECRWVFMPSREWLVHHMTSGDEASSRSALESVACHDLCGPVAEPPSPVNALSLQL